MPLKEKGKVHSLGFAEGGDLIKAKFDNVRKGTEFMLELVRKGIKFECYREFEQTIIKFKIGQNPTIKTLLARLADEVFVVIPGQRIG